MIRSAAKNHKDVSVLVDPKHYEKFVTEFLSLLFLFTASSTVMTLSMQARVRIRDLVASTPNINPFKASKLEQRKI